MAVTTDQLNAKNQRIFDTNSAGKAFTITPSNTNYLADANDVQFHTRGIMVTGAGTVTAIFADDTAAIQLTLLAGVLYPFAVKRINATGTAATGIIGFR